MKYNIHFGSIEDLQNFVGITSNCDFDINIYDNHRCLDGKSIVALANLDLKKNFIMEVVTDNTTKLKNLEESLRGTIIA